MRNLRYVAYVLEQLYSLPKQLADLSWRPKMNKALIKGVHTNQVTPNYTPYRDLSRPAFSILKSSGMHLKQCYSSGHRFSSDSQKGRISCAQLCHFYGHMSLLDKPQGLPDIMHPFHQHSQADWATGYSSPPNPQSWQTPDRKATCRKLRIWKPVTLNKYCCSHLPKQNWGSCGCGPRNMHV